MAGVRKGTMVNCRSILEHTDAGAIRLKLTDQGMCTIRGIAALVVVLDHSIQIFLTRLTGAENLAARIAGWLATQAVAVFFIISGYLITQSILKNLQRNAGQLNFIDYASARISRIYPPLIFAILASLLCYLALQMFGLPGADAPGAQPFGLPDDAYSARDKFSIRISDITNALLMNNGLLQVDGPLWSLCIEWRIYFIVAFLALSLTSRPVTLRLLGLVLCAALFVPIGILNSNTYYFFLTWLAIWLMGSGIALAQAWRFRLNMAARRVLLLLLASAAAGMLIANPELVPHSTMTTPQEYAFQLVLSLLYLGFLFPLREVEATAVRRALMKLGDFSYTLYIVHFPLMLFLLSLTQGMVGYSIGLAILSATVAVASILAIAHFSARYFERKDLIKPLVERILTRVYWSLRAYGLRKAERGD